MSDRIDKKKLVERVAQRVGQDANGIESIIEATFEEIYEALKRAECVSLRDFGTFFVEPRGETWVFKQ